MGNCPRRYSQCQNLVLRHHYTTVHIYREYRRLAKHPHNGSHNLQTRYRNLQGPYMLSAYTRYPGQENGFTLSASSKNAVQLNVAKRD